MTPWQEKHLSDIQRRFADALSNKYRSGQATHGGNLWERANSLTDLSDEIIDSVTYLHCVRDRIDAVFESLVAAKLACRNRKPKLCLAHIEEAIKQLPN